MATEHLLRQGWRRPACITDRPTPPPTEQRRRGYEDVVRRHGLAEIVRHVPFHADSGLEVIDALFDGEDPPDAMLTVGSMLALEVIAGVKRRGLKIGRDLGLIGFDDAVWAPVVSRRSR